MAQGAQCGFGTEVQGMGVTTLACVERHEDIFGVALLRVNPLKGLSYSMLLRCNLCCNPAVLNEPVATVERVICIK